jgi:hypothetical protein
VTLPELAERMADDICAKRLSLGEAAKTMPIGKRADLGRWRGERQTVLSGLFPANESGDEPMRIGGTDRERPERFEPGPRPLCENTARRREGRTESTPGGGCRGARGSCCWREGDRQG